MKHNNNIVAAGCFPVGTRINTPSGYRFIEDVKVGDEVFAFDLTSIEPGEPNQQPGRIFKKKVTEVFKHSFGEVGYTSPLLHISYASTTGVNQHSGILVVTGNHYILTPSRQSEDVEAGFARADALEIGDTIWTQYGDAVEVTAIDSGDKYDFVYNFEVEDLHTYIAEGIRVHNGGGGKGKSTPHQSPNSVTTNQVIRVLLSPGEGEIGGLFYGEDIARSVYFDGTPLRNEDGTYNFTNISVEERVGLPDQSIINGFSVVEAESLLGQALTTVSPIIRTVSTADVDAVRITVEFPQGLQRINKENGDAGATEVSFVVDRRNSGGTWQTVFSPSIREMSSGPFTASYLMERPTTPGTWEWRATRTTPDSTDNSIINATTIKSFTEIQEAETPAQKAKLQYNNRALVALTVGANSTNGKIPSIALDLIGKLVKVPSNYNPITRAYTGAWNGTFSPTLQWTDNPAWIIYDLLLADRYGLGQELDEAQIDKWSFYAASVYNDELVNDGKGTGTFEPRFTFNAQLMVQENGWKVLNSIAAVMNAKILMHAGVVRIAQDRPATATRIINNSNVVDGLFSYSSSRAEDTITICNVTYSDPTSNFLPRTVSEIAGTADRLRHGDYSADIAAYGCASEGQARRAAKWMIDTSVNQTALVSFNVSLENAAFEPHEVFYLMDSEYSQTTQEGRLVGISGTTLTLDKPINKTTGTWTITVYGADGQAIESRTITSGAGISSTITISAPITAPQGAVYVVTGAVAPRMFRLVSMTDNGDLTYSATALEYDANKYARIETGVINPDPVYWQQPSLNVVDRPTNMVIKAASTTDADGVVYRFLDAAWTPPADGTAVTYEFNWTRDGQPLQRIVATHPYARIPADFEGLYEMYVTAINSSGVASPTLSGSFTVSLETADGSSLIAPTNLGQKVSGTSTFSEENLNIKWLNPVGNDQVGTTLKDFEVRILSGATLLRTVYVEAVPSGTYAQFAYTFAMNQADGGPRRAITVQVRSRDTMNKLSPAISVTFNNPAPAVPSNLAVVGALQSAKLTMTLPTDADFKGVLVWMSTTNGFAPSAATLVYDGSDNYVPLNALNDSTTYFLRVAAYDDFGKALDGAGLNVSTQMTATTSATPGIQEFATNPGSGTEGDVIFNTTDGKLYRYHAGAWTAAVPTVDLVGTVSDAQIAALAASKITGQVSDAQVAAVAAAKLTGQLVDAQVQSIAAGKVTGTLTNSQLASIAATKITGQVADAQVAALAASKLTGQLVDAQVQSIAAGKITGTLGDGQLASIAASKITGLVADTQIAAVAAAKVTGQIVSDQVASLGVGKLTGQLLDSQISSVGATKITGQLADAQVAAVAASKVTGQLVDAQISSLAASKLSGPILNAQIQTVDAVKISGQLSDAQLASISAAKIAGQINATQFSGNIGGGNLVGNSSFELDSGGGIPQGFSVYNNAEISVTPLRVTPGRLGGYAYGLRANATSHLTFGILSSGVTGINGLVSGGWKPYKTYVVSYWARKVNGAAWGGMGFGWNIAPASITQVTNPALTTEWQRFVSILTWGANTEATNGPGTYYITVTGSTYSGDELHIDDLQIEEGDVATAYAPRVGEILPGTITVVEIADNSISAPKLVAGSVVAGKIAANAIAAENIQAGSITAGKLSANSVSTANLVAGAITADKIAADTITAAQIAANAITANELAANSVTAGKVAANTITSNEIAANTIVARNLVLRNNDSVDPDPSFRDPTYWAPNFGGAWPTQVYPVEHHSYPVARVLVSRAGMDYVGLTSREFVIEKGASYKAKVWLWKSANITGSFSIVMHVPGVAYDAIGIPRTGTSTTGIGNDIDWAAIPSNQWVAYESVVTGGSVYDWFQHMIVGQITNAELYFGMTLTRMASANLIVDGAVVADKIAAGAVTTAKLVANAVTANEIAAGAVVANKIAAGAVTTDKLLVASQGAALNADPGFLDRSAWSLGEIVALPDGKVGNFAMRSIGAFQTVATPSTHPIDPSKVYRVRAWARRSPNADGTLYLGVQCLDSNGNNIGGNGSFWYTGAVNNVPGNDWTEYVGYFNTPGSMYFTAACKNMRLIALMNYGGSGAGFIEIQDYRIEEVLPGTLIQDGAITTNKITARTITADRIASGAITANEIAASTITGSNIVGGTITAGLIAADAINASHIQAGAISASEIAAGAITGDKIAANTITGGLIAADAVTSTKIAASQIYGVHIVGGTITAGLIAADAINASHIQAGAISASEIAAGAITGDKIAANTISGTNIAGSTIVGGNIAGGTITGSNIAGSTITGSNIVAGSLTAGLIAADQINASHIQAGAIGASEIAAGAITTEKLAVSSQGQAINHDPHLEDVYNSWNMNASVYLAGGTTAPGASGGSYLYVQGGARDQFAFTKKRYTIDPSKTYKLSAKLFASITDSDMYLYVNFFDVNGNTVTTPWGGSMSGYTHGGPPIAGQFTEYGGLFGTGTARGIPANVKTAEIGVWFQYSGNGSGAGLQAAQDIRLERANDGTLIADGAITTNKVAANSIVASHIQADAVNASHIAANSITASELAANSVTAGAIAASQIGASHIVAGSITSDRLVANTITGDRIAAGAVTASNIAGSTITGDKIAASAVTADKLNVGSLAAITATIGTLRTSTYGARTEIKDNVIKVYDSNNVLRVQIGDLSL